MDTQANITLQACHLLNLNCDLPHRLISSTHHSSHRTKGQTVPQYCLYKLHKLPGTIKLPLNHKGKFWTFCVGKNSSRESFCPKQPQVCCVATKICPVFDIFTNEINTPTIKKPFMCLQSAY